MSTTRAEILQALRDNPDGLTSKELAPLCPAAECDEMIVGRVVATLRAEEEINAPGGFRDGATIYKLGAPVRQDEVGPRITLPESGGTRPPPVSAAALAIAAMRQPKAAPVRALGRAPTPATTPAPAPAQPLHQEVAPMSKKDTSVAERVVEALTKHGPLDLDALSAKASTTKSTLYTMLGTLQKKHGVVRVSRGIYGMKGVSSPAPSRPEAQPDKKKVELRARADRPRRSDPPDQKKNGNGTNFGINEHGELGIDAGEKKIVLDAEAFARLREFIERTKPVWDGAGA